MANIAEKDEYEPLFEVNGWDETKIPEVLKKNQTHTSETDNPEK